MSTSHPRRGESVRRWLGRSYPLLAVGGATAIAGGVFLQAMMANTDGRLGPPIDDAYIYFNYARHMASGAFLEYNPGDGVSTGATSLLWMPLLAMGHLIGFRGELIMLWAVLLSAVCLLGYGLILVRLGERLLDSRPLATMLATAIVLEGRVLWGFWSGMEIGLYLIVQLGVLYAFVRYQDSGGRRALWLLGASLAALVLARPEGQFLALFAIGVFLAWKLLATRRADPPTPWWRAVDRREWLCAALPVALIVGQYLLYYLATGETSQNGMRTKSHLYAPDANPWEVLDASFKFYRDMIFRHFPWFLHVSLRHVLDLFFFFGFFYGMGREAKRRQPGMFWVLGLWFFGGLGIQSLVLNAAYHHGRYQMNYTFIFWLVLAWGVRVVLTLLPIKRWQQRFVLTGGAALLLLLMAGTVVHFRSVYAKDVRTIHGQHAAMGRFIAEELPQQAAVALNDAGAIAYLGDRYVYDLFGLTTNVAAHWKWLGEACIWEQVQHLTPDGRPRRPDYFAVYDKWYPKLTALGFLEEITSFDAPEKSIAGGPKKTLFRVRWDKLSDKTQSVTLLHRADGAAEHVIDSLDIAYRPDEMAHEYEHLRHGRPSEKGSALIGYFTVAGQGRSTRIADGGRHIEEQERLTVHGITPGRPLTVIRRTTGAADAAAVLVDGEAAGAWPATRGGPLQFREDRFEIPASWVRHDELRLTFKVTSSSRDEPRASQRRSRARKRRNKPGYRIYYYWFAQPTGPP